jgi:hypothetical protein
MNTVAPTVSGTPQDGRALSGTRGTWTAPSALHYSYNWLRCDATGASCANIAGAVATSYTAKSADVGHVLQFVVTATDNAGDRAAASATAGPVLAPAPPASSVPPAITGTAQDGQTLHAARGTWTSPDQLSYAYQWQLCNASSQACADVKNATGASLRLTSADVGGVIALVVTATDKEDQATSATATTTQVADPARPMNTTPPKVTGTFAAGKYLQASHGTWSSPDPLSYSYQWQDCDRTGTGCANIAGATHSTYKLRSNDVTGTVTVVVTATDKEGQTATATATPAS